MKKLITILAILTMTSLYAQAPKTDAPAPEAAPVAKKHHGKASKEEKKAAKEACLAKDSTMKKKELHKCMKEELSGK